MSDLFFRQWLSGRDFARDDEVARSMRNFTYAIGDLDQKVAVLVDPAYRPAEIVGRLDDEGIRVVGVVATHYHADHVGGRLGSIAIEGLAELLEETDVPVHVNRAEAEELARRTGIDAAKLTVHDSGGRLDVGALRCTLIHTPGHTPGSQCLFVDGRLLTGDTLFIDGCGRTDLPGGDPAALYDSLFHRLSAFADDTTVYPGHDYSHAPSATLGDLRAHNQVLTPLEMAQWLAYFG